MGGKATRLAHKVSASKPTNSSFNGALPFSLPAASEKSALRGLTERTSVVDLLPSNAISMKYIGDTDTAEELLRILNDNRVTSLPVLDIEGRFLGFADMLLLMKYVYNYKFHVKIDVPDKNVPENPCVVLESSEEERYLKLEGVWEEILKKEIREILKESQKNVIVYTRKKSTLRVLLPMFSSGFTKRCLVNTSKTQTISSTLPSDCTVCSQTDIIRFLGRMMKMVENGTYEGGEEEKTELSKLVSSSIESLLTFQSEMPEIVTIGAKKSLLYATEVLMSKNLPCLGLIEEETGRLIGNFSTSDLKGLRLFDVTDFRVFRVSIEKYLKVNNPGSLNIICVNRKNTFAELISNIVESKVHTVWVVDMHQKPLHVVTLTDILKMVHTVQL